MKRFNRSLSLFGLLAFVLTVICGTAYVVTQVQVSAQEKVNDKKNGFEWKRKDKKIESSNGRLTIAIPNLGESATWMVAIKPVDNNSQEKMSVGLVGWQEDESNKSKRVKFKKISNVDDVSNSAILSPGNVNLTNASSLANGDGSLAIYLEVGQGTAVNIEQNGRTIPVTLTDKSVIVSDGGTEEISIQGPSELLRELQLKKWKKAAVDAGIRNINVKRNEN